MGSPIIAGCWTVNGKPVYSGVTRRMPPGRGGKASSARKGCPTPFSAGGCRQAARDSRAPRPYPGRFLFARARRDSAAGRFYLYPRAAAGPLRLRSPAGRKRARRGRRTPASRVASYYADRPQAERGRVVGKPLGGSRTWISRPRPRPTPTPIVLSVAVALAIHHHSSVDRLHWHATRRAWPPRFAAVIASPWGSDVVLGNAC
jgi:hypothetical protein